MPSWFLAATGQNKLDSQYHCRSRSSLTGAGFVKILRQSYEFCTMYYDLKTNLHNANFLNILQQSLTLLT